MAFVSGWSILHTACQSRRGTHANTHLDVRCRCLDQQLRHGVQLLPVRPHRLHQRLLQGTTGQGQRECKGEWREWSIEQGVGACRESEGGNQEPACECACGAVRLAPAYSLPVPSAHGRLRAESKEGLKCCGWPVTPKPAAGTPRRLACDSALVLVPRNHHRICLTSRQVPHECRSSTPFARPIATRIRPIRPLSSQ